MAIQSLKKVEIESASGVAAFDLYGLLGGVTSTTDGTVNSLVCTLSAIPLVGPLLGCVLGLVEGVVSL